MEQNATSGEVIRHNWSRMRHRASGTTHKNQDTVVRTCRKIQRTPVGVALQFATRVMDVPRASSSPLPKPNPICITVRLCHYAYSISHHLRPGSQSSLNTRRGPHSVRTAFVPLSLGSAVLYARITGLWGAGNQTHQGQGARVLQLLTWLLRRFGDLFACPITPFSTIPRITCCAGFGNARTTTNCWHRRTVGIPHSRVPATEQTQPLRCPEGRWPRPEVRCP